MYLHYTIKITHSKNVDGLYYTFRNTLYRRRTYVKRTDGVISKLSAVSPRLLYRSRYCNFFVFFHENVLALFFKGAAGCVTRESVVTAQLLFCRVFRKRNEY